MSSIVSPAQRLPVDVILSIIKYVVNEKSLPFGAVSSDKRKLIALLPVCRNWRQAALEYIWHEVKLKLNPKSTGVYLVRLPWIKEKALPQSTASLVKVLHIDIYMSGIVNGNALKCLTKYLGDAKCYPFANRIIVTLNIEPTMQGTVENVLEFAQLVKMLAPAAKAVEVMCVAKQIKEKYPFTVCLGELDEVNFGVLVKSLCGDSTCAKLDTGKIGLAHVSTIDSIPQLSWLQLLNASSLTLRAGIVHKSANTLKYLDIEIADPRKLLHDVNSREVVYPNLQHLCMYYCQYNEENAEAVSPEFVPLPVLKSLRVTLSHDYFDDILLRGNGATLEYLEYDLSKYIVEKVNNGDVFNKHTALRHVVVDAQDKYDELCLLSHDDMIKFLTNLTKNAKRLVVSSSKWLEHVVDIAPRGHEFQNISVLEIRKCSLSLLQVLNMVKELPHILRIRCCIYQMGSILAHVAADDVPDHLVSTYGDMETGLEVWEMTSFKGCYDSSEPVTYMLLLALLCPKLRRMEILPETIPKYRSFIAEALESGPFSKYASQLGHVVDIIYE